MFSPGSRRVEQKKTVFRHRLFFVLCFRERLMQGAGSLRAEPLRTGPPPEARRAVGHAANLMGGGEKNGRRASTHAFSRGERGRRVLLLCAGARSRWAECGAQVRTAFFRKRSVIFWSGIGHVPDGGLSSRTVRRAVACSERTRLLCLWNKCSSLFLGRVGKYAHVVPGNSAADRQGRKKKKMNKIA